MSEFLEALRCQYGERPFKAADVVQDMPVSSYPPALQYAREHGASFARSVGRTLGNMDGVETVHVSGSHPKLWRVKP